MRTFDLAPLYRSTVGFDRLFSLLDQVAGVDGAPSYPPYNIERTGENAYRITLAVAGFTEADLSIEKKEDTLTIRGEKQVKDEKAGEVLYQGEGRRGALSGHCRARLRAPLPARRPRRGQGRHAGERSASRRSRPRGPRDAEAAPDPDRHPVGENHRRQGREGSLTPDRECLGSAPLGGALSFCARRSSSRPSERSECEPGPMTTVRTTHKTPCSWVPALALRARPE